MKVSYIYKNEDIETLVGRLTLLDSISEDNSSYIGNLYIKGDVPSFLDTDMFYGWKVFKIFEDSDGNTLIIKDKDFVKFKHNFVLKVLVNDDTFYYLYFDEDTSRDAMEAYFFAYLINEEDYLKIQNSIKNDLDLRSDSFFGGLPRNSRKLFYVKYGYKKLGDLILEHLFV